MHVSLNSFSLNDFSFNISIKISMLAITFLLSNSLFAQDAENKIETKIEVKPTASELEAEVDKAAVDKTIADKKPDSNPAAKKMVQNATINLQTTVTGNQEQPRVLYILPWQSPQAANVDFESLDNQQKAVFGHIEREELRRELESAGEL